MTLEEITSLIIQDKEKRISSYCRYPIRFLFLDLTQNPETILPEIVSLYQSDLIYLQDKIKSEDGWLTKHMIMKTVKECSKTKDTFILGFSEIIRFYSNNELESLILSLLGDIENDLNDTKQSKRRIYIVCFSMKEYLQEIVIKKFRRYEVYNPFININLEYSSNLNVYFLDQDLKSDDSLNILNTSKEWLSLSKRTKILDLTKPIFCLSKTLYEWYEKISPDNAFQIDKIDNYKDLIKKLFSLDISYAYQERDLANWKNTYNELRNDSTLNLEKLLLKKCNLNTIDYYNAIERWYTEDDQYIQWLLSIYLISNFKNKLGTKIIIQYKDNKQSFFVQLFLYPYLTNDITYNEERNGLIQRLISKLEKEDYEKDFYGRINTCIHEKLEIPSDKTLPYDINNISFSQIENENIIQLLYNYVNKIFVPSYTGCFSCEKELFISFYSLGLIKLEETKDIYPELYYYCNCNDILQNADLNNYFNEYRKSKLHGQNTEELNEQLKKLNTDENSFYNWYHKYKTQTELLRNSTEEIYIIDGLGAEYIPVIQYLIEKNGYTISKQNYAYSHIPSITSINKKYIYDVCNPKDWFEEFDSKVIHGDYYKTTKNLRKAFDTLTKIITKIIKQQNGKDFIITADHGATGQGKWCNTNKVYDFKEADHEGRCFNYKDKIINTSRDYLLYKDADTGDNWCIALKEISLCNNPRYEDHGGATPEEIVVPFIFASKNKAKDIEFDVYLIENKITGLNKKIQFRINPSPENIYVIDGNNNKIYGKEENSLWNFILTSGKSQEIRLFINNETYNYHIENANAANMKGDNDGFDDFD